MVLRSALDTSDPVLKESVDVEGERAVDDLIAIRTGALIRPGYRYEQPDTHLGAGLHRVGLQRDLDFGLQSAAGAASPSLQAHVRIWKLSLWQGTMVELAVSKWDTELCPGVMGRRKVFVKPWSLY